MALDPSNKNRKKPPKTVIFGPATKFAADVAGVPTKQRADTRRNPSATPSVPHQAKAVPADPQVLSRQRALRAAGYPVAVDGIWGPQSQQAWASYTRGTSVHSPVTKPNAAAAAVTQQNAQHAARTAVVRAQTVQARKMAAKATQMAHRLTAQARAEVQKHVQLSAAATSLAKLHRLEPNDPSVQHRLQQAKALLAARPDLAPLQHHALDATAVAQEIHRQVDFSTKARMKDPAEMTTRELVATTVDSITGTLDRNKPDEVKRVQLWLRGHGHPTITPDGHWSRETNDALVSTYKKFLADERKAQVKALTTRFYDTGVIVPGKPLGGEPAPKPEALLTVLQQGGFKADSLWKQIGIRYATSQTAFLHFQESQLDGIESQLHQGIDVQALAGLGVKRTVEQRVARLQLDAALAVQRGEMRSEQAQAFAKQVGVLGAARNANDLKQRLVNLKVELDAEAQKQMHAAMGDKSKVHGFWGHALHTFGMLSVPSHYITTGVELMAADAAYVYHHPSSALRLTRSDPENESIKASVAAFQEKNPWTQMGLETVFDPLWLVDPVAIVGKVARVGTLAGAEGAYRLEKMGLAVEEGDRLAKIKAPLLTAPAEAITSFKLAGAGAKAILRGEDAVGQKLQLDHFYNVQRKLLRTKQEAVQAVGQRVRAMRRTNFKDIGNDIWGGNPVDGELRFALDKSAPAVRARLRSLAPAAIRHLSDSNLALFTKIDRKGPDSIVGGEIRGYLTRSAQVAVSQNLAVEEAQRVYLTHLFDNADLPDVIREHGLTFQRFIRLVEDGVAASDDPAELDAFRSIFVQAGLSSPGDHAAALTAAQEAFADIIKRIDFRGFGGHDVELAAKAKALMDRAEQDIADTMVLIQDHLDARAEEKLAAAKLAGDTEFKGLWDAEGNWVGAGSDVSRHLLSSAAEGFQRTVRIINHSFDKPHTFDEMRTLRDLEMESAIRSASGTVSRRAAEGVGYDTPEIEKVANAKLDELNAAWEKRPDGSYYDIRQMLDAPAHYASHVRAAFSHLPAEVASFLPDELKHILSVSRGPGAESPVAGDLSDLADAIVGTRSITGFNRKAAGASWHDYVLRGANTSPDVAQLSREFSDALAKHTDLLDQGAKLMTSRELARDWALWAALSKAQTAPLRATYKALSAFLDVWLVATLPLRPGFVVRNVVDNTAKMLADGAIDPRAYFPRAFEGMSSVFHLGVMEMRDVLALGGLYQNNPAVRYFDKLIDSFWTHDSSVLKSIFHSHGMPTPEGALDAMRFGAADESALDPNVIQGLRKMRNKLMHVMANIPENSAKRVLYRDTYYKAIQNGASEMEAFQKAIDRIDFVLFDYSKVSVLEDNLRFVFPFVQFWRKTATFWVSTAAHTPGLPVAVDRFETTLRDKQNADLPEWMRRYVNLEPVAHTLARIPGLDWLAPQLLDGMQTDPLNFFSFNVLYRTFKNENPDLPADKQGMKFIGPFVDALNDWGLSMNPLVRKPAEFAGVFNYRAWQTVFPETGLFEALSRQFLGANNAFNPEAWMEDKTLGLIGYDLGARQRIEANFDQWVQLEMSAQAERGETVDRATAEAKIRHYYLVQTVLGFFSGMYARRRDDADIYLYNLQDSLIHDQVAFNSLSKKDQQAYELFKRRKEDPIAFDAYVQAQPQMEAFYALNGTHEQREAFKAAHPEIIPYVSGWKSANVAGKNFVETLPLLADTDTAMAMLDLVKDIDAAHSVKETARRMFVTPRLQAFWDGNDTPIQVRDKMLQGELHAHINRLQQAYFAIPETDFDARSKFLDANPLLPHSWELNNRHSDDLRSVVNSVNGTLRERYFEFLDSKDYAGARAFLHQFPFIFEFTKAAAKVNADGDWISFGGKHGQTQHSRDFLAAKPYLLHFFELMNAGRKQDAFAYLNATPQLKAYFAKWGKHHGLGSGHGLSQHAQDFLAIKGTLTWFFKLLKSDKARAQEWLDSDNPDAKKVRDYFAKYASSKGMTQHGLDYAKVKETMTAYFKLKDGGNKDAARAYLKNHPELEAYFKKYGHFTKMARKWKEVGISENPDLQRRLAFWQRYWTIEPDQRPSFVAQHADDAGVFVYGMLNAKQREDAQRAYLRQAMLHKGMTKKAALYLRIKPFLDLYYTLQNPSEKDLFLRANPEVQSYLDAYGGDPHTGDKRLDALVEAYFKLDRHSPERSAFIEANPKLQAWFDAHSSPADRAIHDVLDVYFKFPVGKARQRFSLLHPEIQAYFDQRKQERDNELATAMSFDLADPRVAPYLHKAQMESGFNAKQMLELLRESVARNRFGDGLSRRTDRTPTK